MEQEGYDVEATKRESRQYRMSEPGDEELPAIPSADHYLNEIGYSEVRNAKDFADVNLATAAAGFVSFRPITNLLRRWPFRVFCLACTFVVFALGFMYWPLEVYDVNLDSPITTAHTVAGSRYLMCVLALVAVYVSVHGHPRAGALILGVVFLVGAVSMILLWGIWAALEGNVPMSVHRFLQALVRFMGAYVGLVREDSWWIVTIVGSALAISAGVVLLLSHGYREGLTDATLAASLVFCTLLFIVWRAWSLRQAYLATKPDQRRYDEIWQAVRQENHEELKRLAEVVDARQHKRVMQPVLSLEHIFQLGYSLNSWYQEVVAMWAAACNARALPARVKSLQRTLEKVQRSYRGRIPPVIDIVRSSIAVDDIGEVQRVLEHVLDRAIVHQCKNRYDLNYNGELTAGYRDLNLHLSFRQLAMTSFDGFVFELQIHYAPILAVKNEDGHKRYITLRNLRGD